jgi:hypothetical protein
MNTLLPYLSIVATSRNDDHGGDPLIRTQIFIDNLAKQSSKYKLPVELILVDWNPVSDRPGLASVLNVPDNQEYFNAKVITVPTVVHNRIKYSDKLALFQMIAKNVGIRRASGEFILATNIDILFSDELIHYISRKKLDPLKQYRVDRYDINGGLVPGLSLEQTLEYAWSHPVRSNRRYQPEQLVRHLYGDELFKRICIPDQEYAGSFQDVNVVLNDNFWEIHPDRSVEMTHLHTNACGDFTLLSRKGWDAIRGYPEFEAFSFNIDSMGVISAHYAGFTEVALLPPCVCFHIEHSVGSGWTPEGESKLFNRLRQAEILNPEWPVLRPLVNEMREKRVSLEFNNAGWGMADYDLPVQAMGDKNPVSPEMIKYLSDKAAVREVTAIQPSYDLDRLTLFHERRVFANLELDTGLKLQKAQIFIPDSSGSYNEQDSISHVINNNILIFQLQKYAHEFPLRFDPCESSGTIEIASVIARESTMGKVILNVDHYNAHLLTTSGTAVQVRNEPDNVVGKHNQPATSDSAPGCVSKFKHYLLSQSSAVSAIKKYMPLELKLRLKVLLFGLDPAMQNQTNIIPSEPAIRIISNGSDPQIYLPPITVETDFPITLTIEMKFTPVSTV